MSPRSISDDSLRHPRSLHVDDRIGAAVRNLLESGLPALPAVDGRERFAGIFGEREFMRALFPGDLDQLKGAGFLRRSAVGSPALSRGATSSGRSPSGSSNAISVRG